MLYTSEFEERQEMLRKYFFNKYKWKSNDSEYPYLYYKSPKRCLSELSFILDVIWGDEFETIEVQEFKNYDNKLIGYSIIGSIDVHGNFNGIYQGEGYEKEYIKYTLCHKGFFYNQSTNLNSLTSYE